MFVFFPWFISEAFGGSDYTEQRLSNRGTGTPAPKQIAKGISLHFQHSR
jgi:hypothetical protein